MDKNLRIEIILGLAVVVGIFIFTNLGNEIKFIGENFIEDWFIDLGNSFIQFAVIINFAYEIVPESLQVIGLGAIYIKAIETGANPLLFIVGGVAGKLIGQMLLYFIGYYGIRALGKKTSFAGANHFLHKYHFLAYLLPPFTGALGDLILVYSGIRKINLMRIIPILLIADIIDQVRWYAITVGQLQIVDQLN